MKASLRSLSKPVHALPSCTNSIKHAPLAPPPTFPPAVPPSRLREDPSPPRTALHTRKRTDRQTDKWTDRQTCRFLTEICRSMQVVFLLFFYNRHLAPFPAGSHPLLVLVSADVITLKKCDRIPGSKQWRAMRDSHRAGTSESGGGQWTLLLGLRLEKLAMVTVLPVLQNAE